jgi:ferritin
MDAKVYELLNDQVNKEFYSAYLYLDMANYYTAQGLDGFANWFTVQAKEEQDHAIMFYNYLLDSNEKVELKAIAKPDKTYSAFIEPLQESYRHEQYVTSLINGIYAAANAVNDFRTMKFLDYFVTEQGEEEKNASDLIGKMELYGDDKRSLYMLNSELAARTYTAPAAAE